MCEPLDRCRIRKSTKPKKRQKELRFPFQMSLAEPHALLAEPYASMVLWHPTQATHHTPMHTTYNPQRIIYNLTFAAKAFHLSQASPNVGKSRTHSLTQTQT